MLVTEESCLYPAHDLAPYRATAERLNARPWVVGPLDCWQASEQMEHLIEEIERLRAGITWGLSALHDDPEAPRTYERMADLAYEMASRVEALLPPTPAQIAEEIEGFSRSDAISY
jgi:hypothetical protein